MVAVLLLVVAVVGWFWLGRHSAAQSRDAAGECVEGPSTVNVTVDPDIATQVRAAADRYNATKPHVRDHCITVAVNPQASAAMVAGFAGKSWDTKLGAPPALWIPDSSRSVQAMRIPGVIEGTPAAVAVSPIVLAVPDQLRQALTSNKIGWSDLPKLQQGSLSQVGLSGWGGLRMAMPTGDDTVAAAAAVGAAVSGSDPLNDESAKSGQVVSAISRLAQGAPQVGDTLTALTTVGTASPPSNAAIHAVAVSEQQLKSRGGLAEYRPTGSDPVADHPAALLTGTWVDQTQQVVAGMFADYLRAPAQQQLFAAAGFSAAPPQPVPVPAKSVLDQVHSVLANPVLGVQSTVLIDTSAAMGANDGSMTRLNNTVGAISSTLDTMPGDFGLGAWTYAEDIDGEPYRVVSKTAPLTQQHRSDLAQALGQVTATESHSDHTYPALEAAYKAAVSNFGAGRTNKVLLVTAGPNDDSSLTGTQLISDITAAMDPAHPVRIDVIVIGGQGAATLQTLTQKTGGTYTKVATSDNLAFGTAINNALTAP
ncbi:substrate-binding domain-containing protein [Nocardia albiluteola]|uniref:substrate-binding domain-containing protein n=1 Tax=Nocardia albiluteola TaxID=2842303 RepID=UPI0027E1FA8F|nr:substrate-binding domain-containing protein [Nocardia albiluteola]